MLKYLIIAAVFWFNPLISNIDVLPDIVGYLLVLKAFSKASYVYDCASELCTSAKKMCIITGVKIFTIFMVSSLDITMSLLLSFSFAILEAIFGIPFFNKLFTTISYLAPVENQEVHKREQRVRLFTISVFAARLVLAMLPDLTALSLDGAFSNDVELSYAYFRPVFILFSATISLIVCIVWLVVIIKFLNKAVTKEVVDKCNHDFLNRTEKNKTLLPAKNGMRAVIIIAIGSLFIFDFTWGYTSVDIFQDFMFPLVAICALLFLALKKAYKIDKLFFVLLGAFALHVGADIFEMSANIRYYESFNIQSILKTAKAERMYVSVSWSALASVLSLLLSTAVILIIMRKNARDNIASHSKLFSEIDIDYYLKEYNKRTKKNICAVLIISLLYAFIYTLSVVLKPYAEWMTLLNIVFEIAYIISFISAVLYIHDEVYKRIATFG